MSMRSEYEAYIGRQEKLKKNPMARVWMNQESRYVKPFRMYGNLYYVGDDWVCAHLVDTGDGLLLFDAGNCGGGATAMLVQAIWEAGFNPADVRWLVLSHGHVDHIGAVNFFRRMFGTKIFLGAPDAEMFRTRPEFSIIQESTDYMDELFEPDVEIRDGDVISFGNTEVTFRLVPGHTEGTIACFFDVTTARRPGGWDTTEALGLTPCRKIFSWNSVILHTGCGRSIWNPSARSRTRRWISSCQTTPTMWTF